MNNTSTAKCQQAGKLSAPGYYISVQATLSYGDVIRVRGASNLPVGSSIELKVEKINGGPWQDYSKSVCVMVNTKGLFDQDVRLLPNTTYRSDLFIAANFSTNGRCKQNPAVLQIVGSHGERLGNDKSVSMEAVERGETTGMTDNPQLYQVSGWYFGLQSIAKISG